MSATFKCNKTGNTVTFKSQYDIEAMRQHPEYTEVIEAKEESKKVKPKKTEDDEKSVDSI